MSQRPTNFLSPKPSPPSPPPPSPQPSRYVPPPLRTTQPIKTAESPYKDENVSFQENIRYPEEDKLKKDPKKPPVLKYPLWLIVSNLEKEVPPGVMKMLRSAREGLVKGNKPIPTSEGNGGSYYMKDESGKITVGIFKPTDEEPNAVNNPQGNLDVELKRGIIVGNGASREIAAYILDHPVSGPRGDTDTTLGFSGVPLTIKVRCTHETFSHSKGFEGGTQSSKLGSLQMFMENCGSCADLGTGIIKEFPIEEVHKIAVLDLRIGNVDRHAGNILRKYEDGRVKLIPIDHAYTFPHSFEDSTFEWLYWPQAKEPFSKETLDYIKSLDAENDRAILWSYGLELLDQSIRILRILTSLLKDGAARGLTPYDLGHILCRETHNKESMIEKIIGKVDNMTPLVVDETEFLKTVLDLVHAELDNVANKKKSIELFEVCT